MNTIRLGSRIIVAMTFLITIVIDAWLALKISGGLSVWMLLIDIILFVPIFVVTRATFGRCMAYLVGILYGLYRYTEGD